MKKKNVKPGEGYHEKVLHSSKKENPQREKRIPGQPGNDKLSRYTYYLAGVTAVITFIVYLVSLKNDFVEWDDSQYVFENLHIRSFDLSLFKVGLFRFLCCQLAPAYMDIPCPGLRRLGIEPSGASSDKQYSACSQIPLWWYCWW